MRVKLLRKFRKRFSIVLKGKKYVLIDHKEKSVHSPFICWALTGSNKEDLGKQFDFLLCQGIVSLVGQVKHNELREVRDYNRSVRILNNKQTA